MKLLRQFLVGLSALLYGAVFAQIPYVHPSDIAPWMGSQHVHICSSAAWGCGSNPPTFQIPAGITTLPDGHVIGGCGAIYSTSAARNTDGSVSTRGVRILLPTVPMMAAAGITAPGRDGQCEIKIVMGAPGPQQFLLLGLSGTVSGGDKFTAIPSGAGDMISGELPFPYRTPGVLTLGWNGISWLLNGATPDLAEIAGNGQLASHGQGRLFLVTADPPWNTSGTLVGAIAYCPTNGNGLIGPSNGGDMMTRVAYQCVFHRPTSGGPAMEYLVMGYSGAILGTGIAQGAAYAGGTAPDGTVYAGSNYVLVQGFTAVSPESGNTITIFNGRSALGTEVTGTWIYKIVGSDLELHERITGNGVSAPSSFVAGDSLVADTGGIKAYGSFMSVVATSGGRVQVPSSGVEVGTLALRREVIGVAQRGPTGHTGTYQDSPTQRVVASLFNPVEKKCLNTYTIDHTTASATFVEPGGSPAGSEIRCTFVMASGNGSSAAVLGDTAGRAVKYTIHAEVSNNTNGASCTIAASFDNAAAEPEVATAAQGAATNGQHFMLTIRGSKSGLDEKVVHFLTLHMKASAGTCTVYSASTTSEAIIWQ